MQSQHPFAIILSCSDSRVSPELIFNQLHVGSLFIVRNAGNIVDDIVLGSIEYGVKYLESPLIIVLGHERCGAITAAVDAALENHNECAIHIKNIIDTIKPTAQLVTQGMNLTGEISLEQKNDAIKKTAFANIHQMIHNISQDSPIISQAIADKKIKLIGAYYDLDYGNLEFID
jgi:carbonic anhydrase